VTVRSQRLVCSLGLERSAAWLPLESVADLPFLAAGLDFAADEFVALGSCQCRLTIFVSAGEIIFGTPGTIGSGCNVDWLGVF
jgi:hypothetical protein